MDRSKLVEVSVCITCGLERGRPISHMATFWNGTCDLCGKEAAVTSSMDYGFMVQEDSLKEKE